MFTVYYSNQLDVQKDILIHIMQQFPLSDPMEAETILVQSPGMAQWLQWQIAEKQGIACNIDFPMPASFIWQQYVKNFPEVEQQTAFDKAGMTWRLMRLIPSLLEDPIFQPLRHYLASSQETEQHKLYLLAGKIADLFDQYLVYRSDWIEAWEKGDLSYVNQQIKLGGQQQDVLQQIDVHVQWQGKLWQALVQDIQSTHQSGQIHRAALHKRFLQLTEKKQPWSLPKRIFVFGISALPKPYLETLYALGQYCDVHLFFNNGCQEYWGDILDPIYLQKIQIRQRIAYDSKKASSWISPRQLEQLTQNGVSAQSLALQSGNPLLSSWGKLGRDFLYLLTELDVQEITAYVESTSDTLLGQLQQHILHLTPSGNQRFNCTAEDRSISFHSCYSAMREIEALQDYLLHLFNQDKTLTPKDVVVMVADIDKYTPYIRAVFNKSTDLLPFSISDNKLSENDLLVSSFINLLNLKENQFNAEDVLALLDVPAIREKFGIELEDLNYLRYWVEHSGIRFGLDKIDKNQSVNYNSWQSGLERMLLGYGLREEQGIWQDSIGFDNTYGLKGAIVGRLAEFIESLQQWYHFLQQVHSISEWQQKLTALIDTMFINDEQTATTLWYLKDCIQNWVEQLQFVDFEQNIGVEVVAEVFTEKLQEMPNSLRFLVGKINFCTLLPMRAIPFKVVCLLGMNNGEYPRQFHRNSFDLMQYNPQKGDRFRRDDDRYLFLEALLSAQNYFYVSYVGRSMVDDTPREPSVLVSQLLDYLLENLPQVQENPAYWKSVLLQEHSMTAFSLKNFVGKHRTFARQWLPLAEDSSQRVSNFVQPLSNSTTTEQIELSNLIRFVQNPVKFFFEHLLGVYFSENIESIAESENFTLNSLEKFQLNEILLYCDNEQLLTKEAELRVKGELPRGEFGTIYIEQLNEDIQSLKQQIAAYLSYEPQTIFVDLPIELGDKRVQVSGNLTHLYFLPHQSVQSVRWRVGKLRDKDRIETWLCYLLQIATQEQVQPAIFYAKDRIEQFQPLDKSSAIQQLSIYVQDYLLGLQQMKLVVIENLADYFSDLQNKEQELSASFQSESFQSGAFHLEKEVLEAKSAVTLNYISNMQENDPYWQRLLAQEILTEELLAEIEQRTRKWFAKMFDSIQKIES